MSARFRLKSTVPGFVLLLTALVKLVPLTLNLTLAGVPAWEGISVRSTFYAWLALLGATGWWVYSVHDDLEHLVGGYPVSEVAALAGILVPVYNLWGFWTVWDAAGKHLRPGRPLSLRQAALLFYTVWIGRLLIGWVVRVVPDPGKAGGMQLVIGLLEALSWFALYIAVTKGLRLLRKARLQESDQKRDLLSVLK